jgi:predicted XRE-type DNA-binding protein
MATIEQKMAVTESFERSSGNIFADLGVPDPDLSLTCAQIMLEVTNILGERGLNQTEIATLLDLSDDQVANFINGKLSQFSLDRLQQFLDTLEREN